MISHLLQFIAPDNCIGCGEEGSLLCEWCRLNLETVPSRCFYCQKITSDFRICPKCKGKNRAKNLYVALEYKDEAKDLVTKLKFGSKRQASRPIAKIMSDQLPYFGEDTIVVSLPTAPQRVRQRGFDHTRKIAKELAKQKGLRYINVLKKTDNKRQVGSSKKQRLEQSKNSYRVTSAQHIKGKKVVLIDDVITTGASVNYAAEALGIAGAKQVVAATFAYTK